MKCDTIQGSRKCRSRFLGHRLAVFTLLGMMTGTAWASVRYVPLWRQVGKAEVIVSGTITEVRDEGTDKSVGTISVLEVIRGDSTLKTVEVLPGARTRDNMGVSKGQAGVWLLMKGGDKPPAATNTAEYRPTFVFMPKQFTSLVKMVAAGKKDDSVLALYTGWFDDLDMEVVEYAASLRLTGTTAVRTASHALSSPYWSCRAKVSDWLAEVVTTPDDARTALPALVATASRIENINKNGNADARAQAYEAIRRILLRIGTTNAEKLPGWRGSEDQVKAIQKAGVLVINPVVNGLRDSAKETERTEAEAAIRRACDLAQAFMQNPKTKQE
jgi:hypothetical protein